MLHLDRYIIQKGEGVFDLWDFINASLQANDAQSAQAMLNDSFHPIDHSDITGVEGDAAHEAFRKGLAPSEEIARIYHEGPTNPQYMAAFRAMVLAGSPLINSCVEQQNKINASRGIVGMPLPFKNAKGTEYDVDVNWKHKPHAQSVHDTKVNGGYINPWDPVTRQLITNVKSKGNQKGEGWLRPYAEALEARRSQSGVQNRKASSEVIHPGLVHRNVIAFKDRGALYHIFETIKGAQAQAQQSGQDPALAAHQALMQNKVFKKITGSIHHRSFEESYGKYSENAMADPMVQQTKDEEQVDSVGDPTRSDSLTMAAADGKMNFKHFLHPELQDDSWYNKRGSGGKNGHYQAGGGMEQGVKALVEMHGMSEEEARGIYATAAAGTHQEGTYAQRWDAALAGHEMRDGVAPKWANKQGHMPVNNNHLTTTADQPVEALPDSVVQGEGMNPGGGMQMVHPHTAPAPPQTVVSELPSMGPQTIASPPPNNPISRPPNAINATNALGGSLPASSRRGLMDALGEKLGRLYGSRFPGGLFGKSESEKQQIEEYLEKVQIDIAKAELSSPHTPMNSESPIDISLVAGQIKKSSSDITAIIYSRGDWRNIAKSFNIPHEEVQKVKVIFS